MATEKTNYVKVADLPQNFRFLFFSELCGRVIRTTTGRKVGKLDDIVFKLGEHYPEAIGVYVEHGWGKPTEFIPWSHVQQMEGRSVVVRPPESGEQFAPFVDQVGWMLADKHLMGRDVLDIDGRRVETVNDVHLLESKGRMLLGHVDTSFNGFLRRWGLGRLHILTDQLISWKYIQPLNVEDVTTTDRLTLSMTHKQIQELPPEDLADALEELSGPEQQALFSALDSETAAETLLEAEPRAQRQLVAHMRREKATTVLSEMNVPQLADLFSVLPHDHVQELMKLMPAETAKRIHAILSEREVTAGALMSHDFFAVRKDRRVGDVLTEIRHSGRDPHAICYIFVVSEDQQLEGVVDLRELVLTKDDLPLTEIIKAPVISAEDHDSRDDLETIFGKYHFRLLPVVDVKDHLLGVIHYKDIIRGLEAKG